MSDSAMPIAIRVPPIPLTKGIALRSIPMGKKISRPTCISTGSRSTCVVNARYMGSTSSS